MFIAMPGAPLRQFASFKRIPFVRVDIEDNGKGISGEKELAFGAEAQTGHWDSRNAGAPAPAERHTRSWVQRMRNAGDSDHSN